MQPNAKNSYLLMQHYARLHRPVTREDMKAFALRLSNLDKKIWVNDLEFKSLPLPQTNEELTAAIGHVFQCDRNILLFTLWSIVGNDKFRQNYHAGWSHSSFTDLQLQVVQHLTLYLEYIATHDMALPLFLLTRSLDSQGENLIRFNCETVFHFIMDHPDQERKFEKFRHQLMELEA